MPAPDNLKKNQAILWARDLMGREDECVVVCCDTNADALPDKVGQVTLLPLNGINRVELAYASLADKDVASQLAKLVGKKEVIGAAIDEELQGVLLNNGAVSVVDLMERYRQFLSMEVNLAPTSSAQNLVTWVFDALRTMASSSLILDQADTGTPKWTSAHFKVNAGMIDKLRSLIKS
jgi:hypothetical protein